MNLEDQVCTPEQSQILWRLGLNRLNRLETNFYWIKFNDHWRLHKSYLPNELGKLAFPAYSGTELGLLLPERLCEDTKYDGFLEMAKRDLVFHISYTNLFYIQNRNEAQARTETLIWIIDKGYVTLEELKL